MNHYPYYIVTHTKGRLPCPAHLRMTPMKRMFESGKIGGKRLIEERVETPLAAKALWMKSPYTSDIYIVRARNSHREKVRPETL